MQFPRERIVAAMISAEVLAEGAVVVLAASPASVAVKNAPVAINDNGGELHSGRKSATER